MTNNPQVPSVGVHTVGELLRTARVKRGLSIRRVAEKAEVGRSNLLKLEQDKVAKPSPTNLDALAKVLDIEAGDLYAAAGYSQPGALPTFSPYLRTKYAGLPPEAQAELSKSFEHIAKKYGYDADGPAPGQDEN